MSEPTDLLLITHNRVSYLKKMMPVLLADPSDFRIYWWDNASTEPVVDYIESLKEPRIVQKHHATENYNQLSPTEWLLEKAEGDLVGKIDDDVLLPEGWCSQLSRMVRSYDRFGVLACWIFMPEDWVPDLANARAESAAGTQFLQTVAVQGQSCVLRKDLAKAYLNKRGIGFPINQYAMSKDGYINATPVPPLFAHNMDDPRSPHYIPHDEILPTGLTAKRLRFKTHEAYADWIRADARQRQKVPFRVQLAMESLHQRKGGSGRIARAIMRFVVARGLWA